MAENQDEILRDRSKNPNPGESESAPEKPDYEQQIIEIIKTITAPKVLRNKLDDFHAYDIADTFEKLTNFEREKLYRMLDTERLTEILEYLDEEDQARYLNEMNIKKSSRLSTRWNRIRRLICFVRSIRKSGISFSNCLNQKFERTFQLSSLMMMKKLVQR